MNYKIELRDTLVSLAENLLPAGSGHSKILEVCIKFTHKSKKEYVKVIFFHPNNYMLVSYVFGTELSCIDDKFQITSNHDTTWEYDGFNFFQNRMKDSEEVITIQLVKVLEIENPIMSENNSIFSFVRK